MTWLTLRQFRLAAASVVAVSRPGSSTPGM